MSKRIIIDNDLLQVTLDRLCQQLIESHDDFSNSVILALQPRGVATGQRIHKKLEKATKKKIDLGYLDATFFRDDFRSHAGPLKANATKVPFLIEGKRVILVDDVLNNGRTLAYGLGIFLDLPLKKIRTVVLVDRSHRNFPISSDFTGLELATVLKEHVDVVLNEETGEDAVYLR